jgi:hypothetical protein
MQGAVRLNQLPSAEVRAATLASLARYTRVSPGALTRWQARRDPPPTLTPGMHAHPVSARDVIRERVVAWLH